MKFFQTFFFEPQSTSLTVTSSSGLHLRPAATFAAKAKTFKCELTIVFKDHNANAKNITDLLALDLQEDDSFTLIAQGKSAQKALDTLTRTFKGLMYHEKKVPLSLKKQIHTYESPVIEGEGITKGVAIAPIYPLQQEKTYTPTTLSFDEAIALSVQELQALYKKVPQDENADIYLAQQTLLTSIAQSSTDLESFTKSIKKHSKKLQDGQFASKVIDYKDILHRVKRHLGYGKKLIFPNEPFILVSQDLLPSEITLLESSAIQGVILTQTSTTSHTAILLRSAGITSMTLSTDIQIQEGHIAIIDTLCALCILSPTLTDIQKAREQQQLTIKQQEKSHAKRFQHALTKENIKISVLANIQDIKSAKEAEEEGAEGIGLLRTEFLFKKKAPSLKKQQKMYEEIFSLFSNVIVRTLDVGGDKNLPYISLAKEKNPFLGIRGIRLFNSHPLLMEEQLHAILLAAKNRPIKIMFPMVSTVEEFIDAKEKALTLAHKENIAISNIKFGIMIEVPSVLFLLSRFNELVDFYSIGTNDLTQYLFATERTHPSLHVDPLSPVIFSVLKHIKESVNKPISICGELATNSQAIPRLIALGFHTLSVASKNIADTKQEIRNA